MTKLLSGIFGIVQVSTVAGKRKFDVRLFGLDGMSVYCLVVLFGRFLRLSRFSVLTQKGLAGDASVHRLLMRICKECLLIAEQVLPVTQVPLHHRC